MEEEARARRAEAEAENGFRDFTSNTIAVRPDIDGLQATKKLIHELSHALLHGTDVPPSREIAEVEVESVAFVVLDALGLESGDYSFPYVARWANGDVDLVRAAAERAIACAKTILDGCRCCRWGR